MSFLKKFAKFVRKSNLVSNVADKANVSNSNVLRNLSDPAGKAIKSTEEGGAQGLLEYTKSGGITDPGNLFHKGGAEERAVEPPPAPVTADAQFNVDIDTSRQRRRRGYLANIFGSGAGKSNTGRVTLG